MSTIKEGVMKKKIKQPAMVRKTYNLPRQLSDWITKESRKDRRSASSFLAKIIDEKIASVK
jgi:hypothetical protein